MSILDNLPDECRIERRERVKDEFGGTRDVSVLEQTGVPCWLQQASQSEISDFAKRNIKVDHKIFFTQDPNVTENHDITITKRSGVETDISLSVATEPDPDASAGLGVVWKVMTSKRTGETQ